MAAATSKEGRLIARRHFAGGDQADLTAAMIVATLLVLKARSNRPSGAIARQVSGAFRITSP